MSCTRQSARVVNVVGVDEELMTLESCMRSDASTRGFGFVLGSY
jgi:hypothetical protein